MKKVLLATTALIAASAFAAPARAEMEVTVGGFTAFQAGFFDNDAAAQTGRDFQSESQVVVHADGKADNGLEYGAKVTLMTSTNDSTNSLDNSIYLAGAWGRVVLGDELAAGRTLAVFAPTVGAGQINGSADDFITSADRGHMLNDRGDAMFLAYDSIRATNVTYFTPKFAGFQAGVTYTPEYSNAGESVLFSDVGSTHDGIGLGLHYTGEFMGVGVKVGGQYNHADVQTAGTKDVNTWGIGTQLSYKGFTFGGGYDDQGKSLAVAGETKIHGWNVGATYENGPWGVGISYLDTDFGSNGTASLGNDGNGGDYTEVALGATYKVAPGLTTSADVSFYNRDRNTGADTDGTVALIDVTAAF